MTPKVSREHVAARRDQILDAACACFARRGFQETTIRDIREESGLSTGAIYGHFASKDAIVRGAADRARERLEGILAEARAEADPRRGLERLFEALTACEARPREEHRQAIRLEIRLWAAALHSPDLRGIVREWYGTLVPAIADLVGRIRAEEGSAGPPAETTARAIVAAIQGSLLQRMVEEDVDLDLRETVLGWATGRAAPQGSRSRNPRTVS